MPRCGVPSTYAFARRAVISNAWRMNRSPARGHWTGTISNFTYDGNQWRGMSDPFENQHRSSFTLLTCPVPKERSVGFPSLPLISCPTEDFRLANRDHLSFRTLQHKGYPHPVLSRSTPRTFH